MPRSFSDQHHSSGHYSKFEKTKKPIPFLSSHHRNPSLPLIVFSTLSLLIGVSGVIFSLFAIFHRRPIPTFRCGRVEDTFRAFYSLPNARRLGGDSGTGNIADRPKFLGFVGIQTGFGSGNRRKALRSTWFPSDPDGLLR